MILFGEEVFFSDDEAGIAPPPQADYRIRDIGSDDDGDISTVDDKSGTSLSFYGATSLDLTCSTASRNHNTNDRSHDNDGYSISTDSSTTDSSRIRELRARWEYPYSVGCLSTDSDLG